MSISISKIFSFRNVLYIVLFVFCCFSFAYGEIAGKDSHPVLIAHFDISISIDTPINIAMTIHGGKIIPDGVIGSALCLNKGEYLEIDVKEIISSKEGTVTFWVRPHWSYYQHEGEKLISHTFVSMKWNDGRKGYFAISDGWWEPAGSLKTYFVANNQDFSHSSAKILYRPDEWFNITCTWKSGIKGRINMYCDGKLVDSKNISAASQYSPMTSLYIGSDKGSELYQERYADVDFDEINIFQTALNESQVKKHYERQLATRPLDKKAWMNKVLSQPYNPPKGPNGEILETRAIFDEGIDWMSPSGALNTIQRIKRAGFNVYIPCVWHGRGTRYPSKVFPEEDSMKNMVDDPLARVIKIAHANNIEVHPWFTVALRQKEFLKEFYDKETPNNAFDVHRPEFIEFITNLIIDVAERYDIDGINLDYIRTMGLCKCNYCQKEYKKKFSRDLLSDAEIRISNGPLEHHLQQWQDSAIENIVTKISKQSRQIKKSIVVSVDGHPIPNFLPKNSQGRTDVLWANSGLIDIIFNMEYSHNPDFEKHDLINQSLINSSKLIISLGNYDWKRGKIMCRDKEILGKLVNYALKRWQNGYAIYLYSKLNEDQISILSY